MGMVVFASTMLASGTNIPGESQWLDQGILGLLCLTLLIAILFLFRMLTKERQEKEKELKTMHEGHKEEMKALLYELVEAAREQSGQHLSVTDRVTRVLESLERRFPENNSSDRRLR